MYKNRSQGFTLIELLVVIAIIGVLSAVVLASLNSARTKGVDAAVKSNLDSARVQAEIFYEVGNVYTSVCTTAVTAKGIKEMVEAAAKAYTGSSSAVGSAAYSTGSPAAQCHNSASGWAAIVPLKAPGTAGYGWCVDSNGAATETGVLTASSVTCGA